jgi:Flp pilus assembly pilin Flp
MYIYLRLLVTMLTQRWQALRDDDGASTIEYLLLVLLGIAVAGAAIVVIKAAVASKDTQITDNTNATNP